MVKNLKNWINKIYFDITIANIIDLIILYGLFYWLTGEAANINIEMMWLYLLIVIPFASTKQVVEKTLDAQVAFIRGKWNLNEEKKQLKSDKLIHPWHKLGILAFIFGLGLAVIFSLIFTFGGFFNYPGYLNGAFKPFSLLIGIFSIIGMEIVTVLFTKYLIPGYLRSYAIKVKKVKENPEKVDPASLWRKYLLEYVLPWLILIGLINLAIQFKGTTELSLNNAGLVPMGDVANTMFFNTLVFIIWMPLFSSKQIRPDVHLGEIISGKKLSFWVILVIMIVSPIAALLIGYSFLFFGGINFVSVPVATLINILAAVIPGLIGCGIGIIWGRQREFNLIEKNKDAK